RQRRRGEERVRVRRLQHGPAPRRRARRHRPGGLAGGEVRGLDHLEERARVARRARERGRDVERERRRVADVVGVVPDVEVERVRPARGVPRDAEGDVPRDGGAGGDGPTAEADRAVDGAVGDEPEVEGGGAGGVVGDGDGEGDGLAGGRGVVVEGGGERLLAAHDAGEGDLRDPRPEVEARRGLVVLGRVPERRVVRRVYRYHAVVAPAAEAAELCAGAGVDLRLGHVHHAGPALV